MLQWNGIGDIKRVIKWGERSNKILKKYILTVKWFLMVFKLCIKLKAKITLYLKGLKVINFSGNFMVIT